MFYKLNYFICNHGLTFWASEQPYRLLSAEPYHLSPLRIPNVTKPPYVVPSSSFMRCDSYVTKGDIGSDNSIFYPIVTVTNAVDAVCDNLRRYSRLSSTGRSLRGRRSMFRRYKARRTTLLSRRRPAVGMHGR